MAQSNYDPSLASEKYINISENGTVEAGMILETGWVLKVTLRQDKTVAETSYPHKYTGFPHSLRLERKSDGSIVRRSLFFPGNFVTELFVGNTQGEDNWGSGQHL